MVKLKMKTLVLADIHGNYQALKQCLERSHFNYETDKLIVLGDVVDGYPQTYEVVEELLKIKNLVLILGNHDVWFISFMKHGTSPNIWIHQGGNNTLLSYSKNSNPESSTLDDCKKDFSNVIIPVTHQEFFNKGVYYYEQDNMLFVHGGFNDNKNIKEQSYSFLYWDRGIIETAIIRPIKQYDKVFIGHTSTQYYGGEEHTGPKRFNNLLMIDTGAGWNGKLTIMDVNTEEYWQSDKFEGHNKYKINDNND